MDAGCASDESAPCGRRSRVVLTPRRWRQAGGVFSPVTVSTSRSPGSARISRKPLRAGMSGVFRWLAVNTRVHTYYPMRTRGCGCIGRPAFPTPSVFRADVFSKPRARGAARSRRCVIPSLRAQRSNPCCNTKKEWIASRSLSSGAHSRDPLARNDGRGQ